jgi:hypothetical protein
MNNTLTTLLAEGAGKNEKGSLFRQASGSAVAAPDALLPDPLGALAVFICVHKS